MYHCSYTYKSAAFLLINVVENRSGKLNLRKSSRPFDYTELASKSCNQAR